MVRAAGKGGKKKRLLLDRRCDGSCKCVIKILSLKINRLNTSPKRFAFRKEREEGRGRLTGCVPEVGTVVKLETKAGMRTRVTRSDLALNRKLSGRSPPSTMWHRIFQPVETALAETP